MDYGDRVKAWNGEQEKALLYWGYFYAYQPLAPEPYVVESEDGVLTTWQHALKVLPNEPWGIIPLTQPPDSQSCGQHCVAMLAGVRVEKAAEAVGHNRQTRTKDLVGALKYFGMKLNSERLIPIRQHPNFFHPFQRPKAALCKAVHFPRAVSKKAGAKRLRSFHWVVLHEGTVYDPGTGYEPRGLVEYVHECMDITSYIEVLNYGKNKNKRHRCRAKRA